MYLFFIMFACKSSDSLKTTPGWTIGEEEVCVNPLESIHYTDVSDIYVDVTTSVRHVALGSISLIERENQWWVVSPEPDGHKWWSLDGSVTGQKEIDVLSSRIALHDLDGDGIEDLLRYSTFIEIGWAFGTDQESWQQLWMSEGNCGFIEIGLADLDGNGFEDLILPNGMECSDAAGIGPVIIFNHGSRSFSDWVEVQGHPDDWGATFDIAPLDIDADGDLDLYFCNDFGPEIAPNKLLLNDGMGNLSVTSAMGAGVTSYCMTSSFGDLNGDSILDLYVAGTGQHFALVHDEEGYVDMSTSWGFPDFQELEMPWGSAVKDFDNDGLADIALSTSEFSHLAEYQRFPIWIMKQNAQNNWTRVGADWGLPQETSSRALIAHDVNADGILDLLAADFEREPWILLSDGCTADNWLEVEAPSGTVVTLYAEEKSWTAVASRHQGFGASQPSVAHFGLGQIEVVDRIQLQVPWFGTSWLLEKISTRRRLKWAPKQ
jgi:hypothetical protein